MHIRTLRHSSRSMRSSVLALCAALCLMVLLSTAAFANTVEIQDNARVLNVSQVQSDASELSKPIRIFTTSVSESTSVSDANARRDINSTDTIVLRINAATRHLDLVWGKNVSLSSSDYNNAVNAFKNNFGSSNYTAATIALIDSLKSVLKSGLSINPVLGALCCVGLIALVAFGVFGARRRRWRGNAAPVYNAPMGYGPQNYGAPQQGGGMNPWVAGGLGAAGGGFLGYELGKAEGEREARQAYQGGNDFFGGGGGSDFGGGGNFGGGGGSDFGGGGGDFGGGGGSDFGSGGNESFGGFSGGDSNNNDGGGSSF